MTTKPDTISLPGLLRDRPAIAALSERLAAGGRVVAAGSAGSSPALVAAAVAARAGRTVILVVAHIDDGDETLDELTGQGVPAIRLPALEVLPGETDVSAELFAERMLAVRAAATVTPGTVVVAPIQALMQLVPAPARLESLVRTLRRDQTVKLTELTHWLGEAGYTRVEAIEEAGEFAVRGGILDVFPPGVASSPSSTDKRGTTGVPVRLDFFGDQIDKITEIDIETMGSDRAVNAVELVAADFGKAQADERQVNFLELLPRESVVLLSETMEIVEQGRGYYERVTDSKGIVGPPAVLKLLETRFHALAEINQFSAGAAGADTRLELPVGAFPAFSRDAKEAVGELVALTGAPEKARVIVCCQTSGEKQRLGELLAQHQAESEGGSGGEGAKRIESVEAYLHRGFIWRSGDDDDQQSIAFVPYHELLNRFSVRRRAGRFKGGRAMDAFLEIQPGDYVVHVEHGIARFAGLTLMAPREVPQTFALQERSKQTEQEEYLTLEFAGRAKLHVPATQIDQVQKYIGGFAGKPPLSTLGGQKWKNQKERVAESVRDLAAELLRVRAAREHMPGLQYPGDTAWQKEFEAEFPYTETEDQLAALQEIKRDMTSPRPMDRLICGDVGFGKTELAIRAAFKAVEYGKQVAVLVPTTVLAEQHERTFRSRFAGYPFRIESLSRFKTNQEARQILDALRKGQVDVIVGTHRILSGDVGFSDLGLVVIDEEQRFGVEHKEALLRLRMTVDVLTLSATPIPRTLHMAMLGIRDISSLTTPPVDRRAIVTEVIPYNARRVQQAIQRELAREGQVFFVHNRVHDIHSVADEVQKLAPDAKIVVGHGQMNPHELEEVMLKFMRREADILVSTTIIESGIDIPTANTMVINDADRFGLSELHQLRGRVGRSRHRAYCYLLLPPERTVKEVARKRLRAIEQYSMLGAGFKIAMRDLEIRGAGNILGAEQSGHIAAVGYEMYCQLLETAVHNLKNDAPIVTPSATALEIGVSGLIPKSYIPSDQRRLEVYRRLATAASLDAIEQVRADLVNAYGDPPRPTMRLMDLAQVRIVLAHLGVRTATIREKDVVFLAVDPQPVAAQLQKPVTAKGAPEATVRVLPPKLTESGGRAELAEVYFRPPEKYLEPETLLRVLRRRLGVIPEPAQPTTPTPQPRPATLATRRGGAV